jgi:acetylornithine deacetylase/succinyl-diaminopimelate desuccinylase-like protein
MEQIVSRILSAMPENMSPEAILSSLIRIDTVNPPGNEIRAARWLQDLFHQAGVDCEVLEAAGGRGNFLAWLGPDDPAAPRLLLLSHLDVVPPGSGWSRDPFSGEIKQGFVFGRGALDCKGMVASEAAAVLALARVHRDRPLRGRLIFAATADEEKGGRNGIRFLLRHHRPRIAADFVVNEGAEEPLPLGRETFYFIQTGEKGLAWSTLRSRGASAHGSLPVLGSNAILTMSRALTRIGSYRPEVVLVPEVHHLLKTLADRRGWPEPLTPNSLDRFLATWGDRSFAASLQAMTRLTISPNVIKGGIKTNIVPDLCEVETDIRVLPGQDQSYALGQLRQCVGNRIEIDMPHFHPSSFSPADTVYYRIIEEAISQTCSGDRSGQRVSILPMLSPGATDSRWLRQAGFLCYGVAVLAPDFPKELGATIHGADERIDVRSLHCFTRFFIALAHNYLS